MADFQSSYLAFPGAIIKPELIPSNLIPNATLPASPSPFSRSQKGILSNAISDVDTLIRSRAAYSGFQSNIVQKTLMDEDLPRYQSTVARTLSSVFRVANSVDIAGRCTSWSAAQSELSGRLNNLSTILLNLASFNIPYLDSNRFRGTDSISLSSITTSSSSLFVFRNAQTSINRPSAHSGSTDLINIYGPAVPLDFAEADRAFIPVEFPLETIGVTESFTKTENESRLVAFHRAFFVVNTFVEVFAEMILRKTGLSIASKVFGKNVVETPLIHKEISKVLSNEIDIDTWESLSDEELFNIICGEALQIFEDKKQLPLTGKNFNFLEALLTYLGENGQGPAVPALTTPNTAKVNLIANAKVFFGEDLHVEKLTPFLMGIARAVLSLARIRIVQAKRFWSFQRTLFKVNKSLALNRIPLFVTFSQTMRGDFTRSNNAFIVSSMIGKTSDLKEEEIIVEDILQLIFQMACGNTSVLMNEVVPNSSTNRSFTNPAANTSTPISLAVSWARNDIAAPAAFFQPNLIAIPVAGLTRTQWECFKNKDLKWHDTILSKTPGFYFGPYPVIGAMFQDMIVTEIDFFLTGAFNQTSALHIAPILSGTSFQLPFSLDNIDGLGASGSNRIPVQWMSTDDGPYRHTRFKERLFSCISFTEEASLRQFALGLLSRSEFLRVKFFEELWNDVGMLSHNRMITILGAAGITYDSSEFDLSKLDGRMIKEIAKKVDMKMFFDNTEIALQRTEAPTTWYRQSLDTAFLKVYAYFGNQLDTEIFQDSLREASLPRPSSILYKLDEVNQFLKTISRYFTYASISTPRT